MTEYTDEKLAQMLVKVQNLLALAERDTTPPAEADNARGKAEAIMVKYRIEEETARQAKVASGTAAKPTVVVFTFLIGTGNRYRNHYYSMFSDVCYHVGVRIMQSWAKDPETGEGCWTAEMFGFDSDIQLAQLLYTNLRLTFSEKLEPKVDKTLSDAENVYRLRSAGVERDRISRILWPEATLRGPKVTKLYAEACAARGEDPKVVGRSVNAKTFRESYADAFVAETRQRLRRMKSAGSQDGAIVLLGRSEAVDEAFWEAYPHLRPKATLAGERDFTPCPKCAKAKSGSCRDHSYRAARPRAFSTVGWSAGTKAANEADLSRVAPNSRLEG